MPEKGPTPESTDPTHVEKVLKRIRAQTVGKDVFSYLHDHGASAVQDIRESIGCSRDKVNTVLKILKAAGMVNSRPLTPQERVTERVNRRSLILRLTKNANVLVKDLCDP